MISVYDMKFQVYKSSNNSYNNEVNFAISTFAKAHVKRIMITEDTYYITSIANWKKLSFATVRRKAFPKNSLYNFTDYNPIP